MTTGALWLYRAGRRYAFAAWPAVFMVLATLASPVILVVRHVTGGQAVLGTADALLLALAAGVVWIVARRIRGHVVQAHAGTRQAVSHQLSVGS